MELLAVSLGHDYNVFLSSEYLNLSFKKSKIVYVKIPCRYLICNLWSTPGKVLLSDNRDNGPDAAILGQSIHLHCLSIVSVLEDDIGNPDFADF